ncbi:MAG: ATP-binding protein [Hydrogenophaga sp.]
MTTDSVDTIGLNGQIFLDKTLKELRKISAIELLPRASVMIEAMRDIGYSFESAVADIIDNSVAAGAQNIFLRYGWDADLPWIAIIDDGSGMTRDELLESMRPGSRDPRLERAAHDLGRFGLGLKTASFSQCRELTVLTIRTHELNGMRWDLDRVSTTNKWEITEIGQTELSDMPCGPTPGKDGTLVLWRKIDRLDLSGVGEIGHETLNELMAVVRQHLARIFHRFLAGESGLKKIRIAINGTDVEPYDPFSELSIATQKFPLEVVRFKDSEVKIQAFVLPHHSKASAKEYERLAGPEGYLRNQGFYIYRNRRLIIWGSWFRLARQEELTKLARVRIDIPNNTDHHWGIDVRKARAHPPLIVKNRLKQVIEQIRSGAKRPYTQRGRVVVETDASPVWVRKMHNDRIEYVINDDHPLMANLLNDLEVSERQRLRQMIRMFGQTFPAAAFFSDYSNTPKQIESEHPDMDVLLALAKMLVQANPDLDQAGLATVLAGMEPFSRYPDQIGLITKRATVN